MKKITLFLVLFLAFSVKVNAQFVENFDSSTTIPSGWTVLNFDSGNTWGIGPTGTSIIPHSGTNVAKVSSINNNDYLVAPQINVTPLNNRFSFWVFGSDDSSYPLYSLKLSTTTNNAIPNFSVTLIPNTQVYYHWTKITVDLSAYIGQNVYIGIHASGPWSTYTVPLYVDDVVNDAMPSCTTISSSYLEDFENQSCWSIINGGSLNTWTFSMPSPLAGTAHSGSTVALIRRNTSAHNDYLISPQINVVPGVIDRISFWAKSGASSLGTGDHFNVKISTTTPTVANFTTTVLTNVISQQNWTKYTIDLTAYYGQSIYIGFHAISTNLNGVFIDDFVADPLPPGLPQSFEATNTIPSSWQVTNTSNTNAWSVSSVGTTAFDGTNFAKFNHTGVATQNDLLITPQINVVAGVNDRFSFWARKDFFFTRNLSLKVSTTNTNLPSFTNFIDNYYNSISIADSGWQLISVDLTPYVGQSIYLGLTSQETTATVFYVDNFINDRFIPSLNSDCKGIVNLTLQNPLLLNGADAGSNSITFYSSYQGAQIGSGALTGSENFSLNLNSLYQNRVYARIFNTATNTFTVNYFSMVNRNVNFDFVINGNFSVSVSMQNSLEPNPNFQWYQNGTLISGATSPVLLNTSEGNEYTVTYSDSSGCTKTSDSVFVYNLNDDSFTINLSNGLGFITPSIFLNDFIEVGVPNLLGDTNGFTINEDGTINVLEGTSPGIYNFFCTVNTFEQTDNGNWITRLLSQNVTIIIPVNGIRMNAFIDSNGNNIKDNNEQYFPKGKFQFILNNDTVVNSIVSPIGSCTIYESNFSNSYDLSYVIDAEFVTNYTISNASFNDIIVIGTGIQNYNFPISILQNYDDTSITITPIGIPRPGFIHTNKVAYSNNGTQTIASGIVTFEKSNPLAILNISQSGTNLTANGFSYNFTNLLPFETRFIDVLLQTPTIPTVSLGQLVSNSASISLPPNDILPLNNSNTLTQTIIGSYDPNDKTENHGGKILHSTFSSNDYLTYTIQFENTGTANAEKVRINDVLDPKLDENSIRMISASHLYTLERVVNNLNWYFNNINLPPSTPTSNGNGYVTFQIKPKTGFAVGDVIPNTAYIYFDFNPAIVTETCLTEFVTTLENKDFVFKDFYYYPNPVKNSLSISNQSIIDKIEITSMLGQKVISQLVNDLQTEVNFSELTNGVYFVKVFSEGQSKTIRIVKE